MYKFDKNLTYKTRDVAIALCELFTERKMTSVHGTVSSYFTKKGYVPLNKQSQDRVFSGIDCQEVFDHFSACWSPDQLSFEEVSTKDNAKFKRVSVVFKCKEGEELDKRSRLLDVPKNKIVTKALAEYFKKNPIVDYEQYSKEELIKMLIAKTTYKEESTNE